MRPSLQAASRFSRRLLQQPKSAITLSVALFSLAWGIYSGHLPISPGAQAGNSVVSLYVDGQDHILSTAAPTVADVLQRAGVQLGTGDLVEPSLDTAVTPGDFNINVYRARPVTVIDGDNTYHIMSAYSSPHLLAEAAGVKTYPEDRYDSQVVTDFVGQTNLGVEITVERSIPFSVQVDGTTKGLRAQPGTVADALKSAGVALGLQDQTSVPLDSQLEPNESLSVTRVSQVVTSVTTVVPKPVKQVNDPTLLVGQSSVQDPGSDGSQTGTYRISYHNGQEVSRQLIKLTSQTDPVAEVVAVGTRAIFTGSVETWRPLVEAAAAQWGMNANTMMRIMQCESGGNPNASNGNHFGLYQYLMSTWIAAGGTSSNIYDGPTQIQLTARKMALYGTSAWQCQ